MASPKPASRLIKEICRSSFSTRRVSETKSCFGSAPVGAILAKNQGPELRILLRMRTYWDAPKLDEGGVRFASEATQISSASLASLLSPIGACNLPFARLVTRVYGKSSI